MSLLPPDDLYAALTTGQAHSFRDVLHESIPLACIGIYTIWRAADFIDWLVLPNLSEAEIQSVGAGELEPRWL